MQQVYIFLPHSPATEILPQSNSSSLKLVKKLVDALNYYGHGFHRDYNRLVFWPSKKKLKEKKLKTQGKNSKLKKKLKFSAF